MSNSSIACLLLSVIAAVIIINITSIRRVDYPALIPRGIARSVLQFDIRETLISVEISSKVWQEMWLIRTIKQLGSELKFGLWSFRWKHWRESCRNIEKVSICWNLKTMWWRDVSGTRVTWEGLKCNGIVWAYGRGRGARKSARNFSATNPKQELKKK